MKNETITPVLLREALEERYLNYALSTIMHRALPDVRDGLKPVHRRLLYAMQQLKLDPSKGFKKCARVVGDVIGKYHPHGDQSVYDALVRLAQDFSQRYPLVDGQGNFGNIDGDNAAAMRYTEARLTPVAQYLLEGLAENAVDFRTTYDDEDSEPVVLPANFPHLLANGASGIAVGMATSIPPHNAAELCDAALHLIKAPKATIGKLVDYVKGPDFPTGGVIIEDRETIVAAYTTGKGAFRVRARWRREGLDRGQYQIVVSEIPYQVQKSRLIERIADLMHARKLPLLDDIRDESAEDIRLVLVPKSRTVDPALLMESLFKVTELEQRIALNMNVLSKGRVPGVLSLREALWQWLEHRQSVLVRRTGYRLQQIDRRLTVLEGYLVAYLNLDAVIAIIREEDAPGQTLMERFALSAPQAEAILDMRLRALRKLEEVAIRREHKALKAERRDLNKLLKSEKAQWEAIAAQIRDVRKTFGSAYVAGARRTGFAQAPSHDWQDIEQAMIEKEPITVILSQKGWIRALKGHQTDLANLSFKAGDQLLCAVNAMTTDKLLTFSTGGKVYMLSADRLPGGRGHGEPVSLMLDLDGEELLTLFVHNAQRTLLVASHMGNGFVVAEEDIVATTKKGKQILNVKAPDEAKTIVPAIGDTIAVIGENRKVLLFPRSQLPQMGRGKGVRLQRYKDGGLADVKVFNRKQGLTWRDPSGRTHTRDQAELRDWFGERAHAGRIAPQGFPRSNRFGDQWSQ